MNSTTYRTLNLVALLTASTSVVAAQSTMGLGLGETLWSIGLGDWFAIAFLSTAFGALALLQRLRDKEAPSHYVRFVAGHMLGSVMAGFTAFLVMEANPQVLSNRFFQALAIGLAAFLGASFIDKMAAKVFPSLNVTSVTVTPLPNPTEGAELPK